MVNRSQGRSRLKVTGDGRGVVGHAGARLLSDLADRVGLTAGLSAAMLPTKRRRRGHDRGRVLTDLAVMITDGGTAIADLGVLRDQPTTMRRRSIARSTGEPVAVICRNSRSIPPAAINGRD